MKNCGATAPRKISSLPHSSRSKMPKRWEKTSLVSSLGVGLPSSLNRVWLVKSLVFTKHAPKAASSYSTVQYNDVSIDSSTAEGCVSG